jgi:hypothetical protein
LYNIAQSLGLAEAESAAYDEKDQKVLQMEKTEV